MGDRPQGHLPEWRRSTGFYPPGSTGHRLRTEGHGGQGEGDRSLAWALKASRSLRRRKRRYWLADLGLVGPEVARMRGRMVSAAAPMGRCGDWYSEALSGCERVRARPWSISGWAEGREGRAAGHTARTAPAGAAGSKHFFRTVKGRGRWAQRRPEVQRLEGSSVIFLPVFILRKLRPMKLNSLLHVAERRPGPGFWVLSPWRLEVLSHCSFCFCFLEERVVVSR